MSSACGPVVALCPGSIQELRTYWQVPSIAHFIYLFKDGLKLPKIDYQDLEIAFLTPIPDPGTSDGTNEQHLLLKLIIVLLKGYFNDHRVDESSWERYLKKLCRLLWVDREGNPFPFLTYTYDHRGNKYEQEIGFSDLSLEAKAEVVYHLCEYRLYAEDSSDLVAHLVDDELRVEPLGKDSRGNIYWYFFGTRLYRECPSAVDRVDQRRESIIRYRVKEALDQAKKAQQELLEKTKEQEKSVAGSAVAAAPAKKKVKHDPIPGERTSSRISKPVDRLNGHTLRETSSSSSAGHRGNSDTKKSSNSTNHHHHSNNKNPTNSRKQQQETPPDPSTSCGIPLTDLQSAWDCVCDHESEWESLTASFAKSKVPCEVDLFKILSKNFLPLIHEVAEKERREKEKEQKAKILELIPRRTSSRIEIKKIQQVEEEKREAEEREERKRRSAQAEERRKREDERVRQDEIKRQREERARQRLAILEDRAARAAIRKRPIDGPSNGLNEDHKILEEDEDVIDIADPDVTMILSNGWPPNEHSYSSPKGYLLMKAGCVSMSR